MGKHWVNSHFGQEHWVDSHFGTDFGPSFSTGALGGADDDSAGIAFGFDSLDPSSVDFGLDDLDPSGVDFGLDPVTLGVLGLSAVAGGVATTHHVLAAKQLLAQQRAAKARRQSGSINMTDADGELEALNAAEASDPAALRG